MPAHLRVRQTVSRLRAEKEYIMPEVNWKTKSGFETQQYDDKFCEECGSSMLVVFVEADMREENGEREIVREWVTYKCPNKREEGDPHTHKYYFKKFSDKSSYKIYMVSRRETWREKLWRRLTMRAADETYCACETGSMIYKDSPAICPDCGKPFRR